MMRLQWISGAKIGLLHLLLQTHEPQFRLIRISQLVCGKIVLWSYRRSVMDDEAAVSRVLSDYISAFGTLDAQATLAYYHELCLLVASHKVAALPTHAAMSWLKRLLLLHP
jgi:hypothetical protein